MVVEATNWKSRDLQCFVYIASPVSIAVCQEHVILYEEDRAIATVAFERPFAVFHDENGLPSLPFVAGKGNREFRQTRLFVRGPFVPQAKKIQP